MAGQKTPVLSHCGGRWPYARDGRFIEKLGTYNPLLPKDSAERVKLDLDRAKYWLGEGAKPSDRVARFLTLPVW